MAKATLFNRNGSLKKKCFLDTTGLPKKAIKKGTNGVAYCSSLQELYSPLLLLTEGFPPNTHSWVRFDAGATRTFGSLTTSCIHNKYTTLL